MTQRERSRQARRKWQKSISEQARSGQSAAAFCRGRALCRSHLYWWRKRLRAAAGPEGPRTPPTKFVEVKLTPVGPASRAEVLARPAADRALAYVAEGKFAESEPLAREALETDRKIQPDAWQRFRAESLLGATLAGEKKFADAEPLLLEGYQGMLARQDRIAVPDRYHLDLAHQWLVQLYQVWGKPEKAAEWQQRILDQKSAPAKQE